MLEAPSALDFLAAWLLRRHAEFDNAGDQLLEIGAWQSAMPVLTLLSDLICPLSLKGRRLKGFL